MFQCTLGTSCCFMSGRRYCCNLGIGWVLMWCASACVVEAVLLFCPCFVTDSHKFIKCMLASLRLYNNNIVGCISSGLSCGMQIPCYHRSNSIMSVTRDQKSMNSASWPHLAWTRCGYNAEFMYLQCKRFMFSPSSGVLVSIPQYF